MRPTHNLVITKRSKDPLAYTPKCEVGVAWEKEGPHGKFISIQINPGVVLSHRDMEDHFLSLFPVRETTDSRGPNDRPPLDHDIKEAVTPTGLNPVSESDIAEYFD